MSKISTYSTSDKIVFVTVSEEDWVVSAPVSLDTYRLLQKNITFQLSAHV